MAPPDRPNSERESSTDDDEPQPQSKGPKRNAIEEGFFNLTADDVYGRHSKASFIAGQRRRRKFTSKRRREVAAVRSVGACEDCRARKVRCTHVLHNLSSSIPINRKPSSNNDSSDSSNPSSLTSCSSVGTHFGAFTLDRLNHFVSPQAPINRYRDSFDEDPPAGWISDASWTSNANRNPLSESLARLSPKIEHLSNILPPQLQDVKDDYYPRSDDCMQDIDDISKTIPSFLKPSKDAQLQPYIPYGHTEPVDVRYARKPVPGEQKTWHSVTRRETTQPPRSATGREAAQPPRSVNGRDTTHQPRSATDGINKKKAKKTKGGSTTKPAPSMQRIKSEQPQGAHLDPAPQATPPHQPMGYQPPQSPAPAWTPHPQMIYGPTPMYPQQFDADHLGRNLPYGGSPSTPSDQSMGFGPQNGHMQQLFTPNSTLSHQDYGTSSSMLRSGSAHSAHSMQSMNNGLRQLQISQPFTTGQGGFPPQNSNQQGLGTTAQNPHAQWQQSARRLDYGTTVIDNNMMNSLPIGYPSMQSWMGIPPMPGNYALTYIPNNHHLVPPPTYYTNTNQPLNYNTTTPSTSNSSGSMHNRGMSNLTIPPVAPYATSQPPSLTFGPSSEVTTNTPFDARSYHSGEIFTLQNHLAGGDVDISPASHMPRAPMDHLLGDGLVNLNEILSPDPRYPAGYPNGHNTIGGILKPPLAAVVTDAVDPADMPVDMGNLTNWLHAPTAPTYLNGNYNTTDGIVKPQPVNTTFTDEDMEVDELFYPDMVSGLE